MRFQVQQIYFLRRAIGTLFEFAEGIRLLGEDPLLRELPEQAQSVWKHAATYFRNHEAYFKKIRNDVGGHFGQPAALNAIKKLHPTAVGQMQIGQDQRFHFASEIAAAAMMEHLLGSTDEEKVEKLLGEVTEAVKHATRACDVVALLIWPRFKESVRRPD